MDYSQVASWLPCVMAVAEIEEKSQQLAEASGHKSQFLASMSREPRTPLSAIIGLTEMMVTSAAKFGTDQGDALLRRAKCSWDRDAPTEWRSIGDAGAMLILGHRRQRPSDADG